MPITERGRWSSSTVDERGRIVFGNVSEQGQFVVGNSSSGVKNGSASSTITTTSVAIAYRKSQGVASSTITTTSTSDGSKVSSGGNTYSGVASSTITTTSVSSAYRRLKGVSQSVILTTSNTVSKTTRKGIASSTITTVSNAIATVQRIRSGIANSIIQSSSSATADRIDGGAIRVNVNSVSYSISSARSNIGSTEVSWTPASGFSWNNLNMFKKSTLEVGKGQGYFRHYNVEHQMTEIVAIQGKLYKLSDGSNIPIDGLPFGFQTDEPIEAIQYGNSLFIATGTKFVEYDGTTAKVVVPYNPQPLEAMYIGTNGLADTPDNYISDGVGAIAINAVTFDKRIGIVGQNTTFNIVITKGTSDSLEYEIVYFTGTDFTGSGTEIRARGAGNKTFTWSPPNEGEYTLRVRAWKTGNTGIADSTYYVPKYTAKSVDDNINLSVDGIHTCNRVTLHWDRLILYGDSANSSQIYVSHVNVPRYFPIPNTIDFKNEKQEGVSAIVHYRDALLIFMPSSIQAMYGKSPADYQRQNVNGSIGCIAPFSACMVGNNVMFLSSDGVYSLVSSRLDTYGLNVTKVDKNIQNIVPRDKDACGIFYDGQYHIVFPEKDMRLRYYNDFKVWTKDESPKLDFSQMWVWDNTLYGQSKDTGDMMQFDPTMFRDDVYIYSDVVETKQFDFGNPQHIKKLREARLMVATQVDQVSLNVSVFADKSVVLAPPTGEAVADFEGIITWKAGTNPNVTVESGAVVGGWILGEHSLGSTDTMLTKLAVGGKCYKTSMRIEHNDATPNQILGLAYVFKVMKA